MRTATREHFLPRGTDRSLNTMAAAEAKPWGRPAQQRGGRGQWFATRAEAEACARNVGAQWVLNRWNNHWFEVREETT